ncbi:MAG: LysR substrate-binding domain-containing protein, partial [Myxococcota bacterium]
YLELGHVLISPRGDPVGVVDELLGEMGKARRVARTVSNFLVAPAIVAKSDYIVTMSRGILAATDAPLVQLKPPFPLEGFEVSAKWHRRSEQDAALRWLVERLVAIGSQLQG